MAKTHQAYNIVLLPPSDINKEAIRLSNLIRRYFPVEFILDGKNYYPHLTLFQLTIPNKNLERAKSILSDIFQRSIEVTFNKYAGAKSVFLSWDCQQNIKLDELHKKVITKLNPLRSGLKLDAKKLKYNYLNIEDKRQIEKYGSAGLFENFRPHITITRLKEKGDYKDALKLLPERKPLKVVFEKAALGKLSKHGTVVGIVKQFKLP